MSSDPTDVGDRTDSVVEDRLRRLLDDEGARFRAGYEPPSFDDAVRRLALPGEHSARVRSLDGRRGTRGSGGWLRPLLVAAAVLALVGGVVGLLSSRRGPDAVPAGPTPSGSVSSGSATSSFATAAGAPLPGLVDPPPGFAYWDHEVRQYSAGSDSTAISSQPLPAGVVVRAYTRSGVADDHEGLMLTVVSAASGERGRVEPGATVQPDTVVRGRPAQLVQSTCGEPATCTSVMVSWTEVDGSSAQVRYQGPAAGSEPAPLTTAQVLAAAQSFEPSPLADIPQAQVQAGGRTLTLWGRASISGSVQLDGTGRLRLTVAALPSGAPTYCQPAEIATVVRSTPTEVVLVVGQYVAQVPLALHPCPAPLPRTRSVAAQLEDGPLGNRTVIDGSTGRPVVVER